MIVGGHEGGNPVPQFAEGGNVGKDEGAAGCRRFEAGKAERLVKCGRGEDGPGGQPARQLLLAERAKRPGMLQLLAGS